MVVLLEWRRAAGGAGAGETPAPTNPVWCAERPRPAERLRQRDSTECFLQHRHAVRLRPDNEADLVGRGVQLFKPLDFLIQRIRDPVAGEVAEQADVQA